MWRVFRRLVWETATDNTTGLAAQMAYTLLIALAPVLLFLWHLLGLFGTDPAKLHGIFGVLKSFLPPDPKVQDVLDDFAASVVLTGSSGFIANAGILLGIYCGTVFIATISRALSHTYGVTEPRNWWSKYIISFLLLFWFGIVILVCFNAIVFGETLPGAIFFSVGWITVTKLFQLYVARYSRYDATYLALASIIILLTWMYLTCLFLLLGGKLNAILRREREKRGKSEARESAMQPA